MRPHGLPDLLKPLAAITGSELNLPKLASLVESNSTENTQSPCWFDTPNLPGRMVRAGGMEDCQGRQ